MIFVLLNKVTKIVWTDASLRNILQIYKQLKIRYSIDSTRTMNWYRVKFLKTPVWKAFYYKHLPSKKFSRADFLNYHNNKHALRFLESHVSMHTWKHNALSGLFYNGVRTIFFPCFYLYNELFLLVDYRTIKALWKVHLYKNNQKKEAPRARTLILRRPRYNQCSFFCCTGFT